jgi:hypothetical protein
MSFYITLPSRDISNASSSEYRSYLQKEILIPEDDWQVALTGFQYVGQKWGYLTRKEQTMKIQHFGPMFTEIIVTYKDMHTYSQQN